jgi:hypothetical protein
LHDVVFVEIGLAHLFVPLVAGMGQSGVLLFVFKVDAIVREPESWSHFAGDEVFVIFVAKSWNLLSVEGYFGRRLMLKDVMGYHQTTDSAADNRYRVVRFDQIES